MDGGTTTGSLTMDKPHEVIRWVRSNCRWPMREKMAYLMLFTRRSSDSPEPFPSVRTLAEDMGTTKDAAAEAVHRLQALGALEIIGGGGRNGGNSYRLLPPWEALQEAPKRPRGRHAVAVDEQSSNPGQSSNQGQSLNEGQSSNTGLSLIQGQLSLNQGHELSSKQGHKEPIDRANENSQGSARSDKPTKQPRQTRSSPADGQPTEAELLKSDANYVARLFDELAKGHSLPGVTDWKTANGVVQKQLKKAGAPRISREEAEESLRWAFKNRQAHVASQGLTCIRTCWSWWLDVKNRTGRQGNSYQTHSSFTPTGTDPMVLPKGGKGP